MHAQNEYRLGLLFALVSAIAWSTAGFFTRLIPLDSFTLIAWRGLFGGAGLIVMVMLLKPKTWRQEFRNLTRGPELAYILLSICGMIAFITSFRYTSVAHGAVIYATIPFMAGALGWLLLAEMPSRAALLASCAALTGVILMVSYGTDGGWFGDLLAFLMTAKMAISIIMVRRYPDMSATAAAGVAAIIAALICWPLGTPLDVTGTQLLALAAFGIVNSAFGLGFFILGSRRIPAIETALIGALETPLAPLWVLIAFSETPDINTVIGGAIVMSAVLFHILSAQRRVPAALS